jgi:hypothetical protein
MSDIVVVAFVVSCSHQLLICEDINTRSQSFKDMDECRTSLVQLVSEHQRQEGPMQTVLGRCHYLLDKAHEPRRQMLQQQTAGAEQGP